MRILSEDPERNAVGSFITYSDAHRPIRGHIPYELVRVSIVHSLRVDGKVILIIAL